MALGDRDTIAPHPITLSRDFGTRVELRDGLDGGETVSEES